MASCLLIAGEKSGEEHAMSFFSELRSLVPEANFYGVGGEELKGQGMELLYHLKDFSSMGFSEVIGKIPFYFKALSRIENEVLRRGTKVAILVDFQGFNMRLAKRLWRQSAPWMMLGPLTGARTDPAPPPRTLSRPPPAPCW